MSDSIIFPPIAAPQPADEKTFRIISRGSMSLYPNQNDNAGVRPCEHSNFVLDEEWNAVTCGKCKERVDPFAALMRFAEWSEQIERERRNLEYDRWDYLRMQIIGMLDRKQFDGEREAIRRQVSGYGIGSLKKIKELHREITRRVDEDRNQRVEKRIAKARPRVTA